MTVQLSVDVRNDRLDAIESQIGVTPFLDFRTGAQPANCAAIDSGSELDHQALPSDWMAAAAAGVKGKAGTWSGTFDAAGVAGHFRIKEVSDTTCHIQGSITGTGGGGDMELDNINVALGQNWTITQFDLTDGNA